MTRALVAILFTLICATPHAQIETPDEPTVFADFGFANIMPAGCWAPITVAVQAVDDPLSGYVELSYVAGGERISHVAPFATAAQSGALVPMTVHLPWWTDTVSVTAFDEQRGRVASLDYRQSPGPTDARLPALLRAEGFVLSASTRLPAAAAIDAIRASRSANETDGEPTESEQEQPARTTTTATRNSFRPINIAPDRLPPSRLAYDGIDLLILEPASLQGIDPRAAEAIVRWTASGGTLLLLADGPGSENARWLSVTPATANIELGLVTQTPEGVVRPIDLSATARSAGWNAQTNSAGIQVAAAGPLGLGTLALFTTDPLSSDAATEALGELLEPIAGVGPPDDDLAITLQAGHASWYERQSRTTSDGLLYRHIDGVVTTQPPGTGGFILIAAVPLTLVLLLGPFDFILLGMLRRRPLAWLSALAWIAAVGAVAYVAPGLFQTGKADVGTAAATDLILPNLALPLAGTENAAAQLPPHLAGWSAEASLLFHASQSPFELESSTRAAWRPFESGRGDAAPFSGMTFRQTPTGPGAAAHAGIEPLRIPSRIWSLVTLHAQGPTPPTFAVALRETGTANELVADFTNLPETARIAAARVTWNDQIYQQSSAEGATITLAPVFPGANGWDTPSDGKATLATLAVLAGEPTQRNTSIAALQTAGWARIDLLIENAPATSAFITSDQATRTRFTHYRILTPMPKKNEVAP
ncbi:MAG: hypothetical protein AAFZ67_03220 [Planctomycetota bacterium]